MTSPASKAAWQSVASRISSTGLSTMAAPGPSKRGSSHCWSLAKVLESSPKSMSWENAGPPKASPRASTAPPIINPVLFMRLVPLRG
ncbi:DUF3693 domain-containing protein [Pelagibacterium sp. H642]|uniref:DUF3693 domain-containing protein n=1 Tax=Pelagibacterium sp. H642 TaxID=1881069 RepID=UPI0035C1F10E